MRDCCVELAPISTDLGVWTDIVVALLAFGVGSDSADAIHNRRRQADVRRTVT
jgi:hypothetical protein